MYIQNREIKKEGEKRKEEKKEEERRRRRRRRRRYVIQKILRGSIIMCKTKGLYTFYFFLTIYTETPMIYMHYNTSKKCSFIARRRKSYFQNRAL